jgi:hypothetical protein
MKTKVRMVIMSHLSDVQENWRDTSNNTRLNFAKWLLLRYPDTSVEIDPDVQFSLFMKQYYKIQ